MTDAARFAPCDMNAPRSDQTAPLANRPRRESAAHMSRTALAAGSHDLISAGAKSGKRDPFPATDIFGTTESRGTRARPARGLSIVPGLLVISIVFSVITVVTVAVAHIAGD